MVKENLDQHSQNVSFTGDSGFPGLPGRIESQIDEEHYIYSYTITNTLMFLMYEGPPGPLGHPGLEGKIGPKGGRGAVKLKSILWFSQLT